MKILIVSCSLNHESRSAALAAHAAAEVAGPGVDVELIDLRELDLPFCDAGPAYSAPHTTKIRHAVTHADAILLAVPIYNYDVNAAAKNLVELTGKAWAGKIVGFLCAAGGRGSYMSVMALANSLMLDFRCLIIPRFVYATGSDFQVDGSPGLQTRERIDELCEETVRVAGALREEAAAPRDSRPLS